MEVKCIYYYISSYAYLKPLNTDSILHKQTHCFFGTNSLHFLFLSITVVEGIRCH